MKKMKRIMCLLLAMVMAFSVGFAVTGTEAKASDSPTAPAPITKRLMAPKKAICGVGAAHGDRVYIPLQDKTGDVKNIKAYLGKKKTKQLVVKKVSTDRYEGSWSPNVELEFYAKKAGKYTVKYDLYTNGVKTGKGKFTVKAEGYGRKGNGIFSSVTIDNKNMTKFIKTHNPKDTYYTKKDKIKIKFKTTSRYKIAKIEMIYYDKDGNKVTKRIKNGKKVKLGQYADIRSEDDTFSKDVWAMTTFKVTYEDKYDQTVYDENYKKEEKCDWYYVCKRAKKWCTYKPEVSTETAG